jgi:hypothetical protein
LKIKEINNFWIFKGKYEILWNWVGNDEKRKNKVEKPKIDGKSRQLTISAFRPWKYGKLSKMVENDWKGSNNKEKGKKGRKMKKGFNVKKGRKWAKKVKYCGKMPKGTRSSTIFEYFRKNLSGMKLKVMPKWMKIKQINDFCILSWKIGQTVERGGEC